MTSSSQIERTAAAWLARRDAGAWSADDQAALDAWLAAATAHRVAFLRLEATWRRADRLRALGAGRADPMPPPRGEWTFTPFAPTAEADAPPAPRLRPHRARSRARTSMQWLSRGLLAAAACLVLAAVVWQAWHRPGPVESASYATAVGALREVPLADGSRITLSSDSQVRVTYSRDERHIELQRGEAFFEVAKNPGRPFTVVAGPRRVTAVGTRFDVRREQADLRVVVTQGVVRLEAQASPGGQRQPVTLLPAGSVALASGEGVTVQSGPVAQAEDRLRWRSGFLVFHDTPLASAAAEFNRYNTRKIVVGDAATGALRIGGNFRWSNAEAFARLLQQGFPVRVEQRPEAIVLHRR
jgi:transmembrane sensor